MTLPVAEGQRCMKRPSGRDTPQFEGGWRTEVLYMDLEADTHTRRDLILSQPQIGANRE